MKKTEQPFVLGEFTAEETERLRYLRSNLLCAAAESQSKIILTASDCTAEESARTVLQLACALAAADKKVLVIDLDRRSAPLGAFVQATGGASYNDCLAGKAKGNPASSTKVDNLYVIAAEVSEARDLGDDRRTVELVGKMAEDYDFLFLLAAPVREGTDVYSLCETADSVMVLVKKKATRHRFLKEILEYCARRESEVLGIVLI